MTEKPPKEWVDTMRRVQEASLKNSDMDQEA